MRTRWLLSIGALTLMAITACGGGGSGDTSSAETSNDEVDTSSSTADTASESAGESASESSSSDTASDTASDTTDGVEPFCGDGTVDAGEDCDDGNQDDTDACTSSCKSAKCGDGIVQAGVEQCDDGNMVDNDGCTNTCKKGPSCGTFFTAWNGWNYYKVMVNGAMTDVNVRTACEACGLKAPCDATDPCTYNDGLCLQTTNETSCGNPMLNMAKFLCGANASPSSCAQLYNTYQYMGTKWQAGSSCGAKSGSWCVQGNGEVNQQALCVQAK